LNENAFGDDATAASSSAPAISTPPSKANQKERTRGQAAPDGPQRAREAIDLGLQLFAAGNYKAALDNFSLSLELPGSGLMRMAGSPREISCASPGEENSALYNMACCWSRLGEMASGITCLEALLDNGFEDYQALRKDPDLAALRSNPDFDKLLSK
jgi:tetratricopeptide (TPR) repeat protein